MLPGPARMSTLASWTSLDDAEAQRFAGTARYRVEFDAPAKRADAWELDLGDVRETARVTLNGKRLATAWSLPFKVRLDGLKARGNVLEIEVTNLAVEPHPRSRRAQGAVEDHARDQPRQRASTGRSMPPAGRSSQPACSGR